MSKQKVHNKILVVLRSGNIVTVDEIKAAFASDEKVSSLLYRLSTYVYDARKYEKAIVRVIKDGRKVTGYQLVNHLEYTDEGFHAGNQVKPASVSNKGQEAVQA
jgi:hypothetical protein